MACVWLYDPIFECRNGGVHRIQALRADLKLRPAWATQLSYPGLPLNQKFAILSRVTNCQLPGPSGSTPQPALGLLGHVFVPGFYVSAGILSQVPVRVGISLTELSQCLFTFIGSWKIQKDKSSVSHSIVR